MVYIVGTCNLNSTNPMTTFYIVSDMFVPLLLTKESVKLRLQEMNILEMLFILVTDKAGY